MINAKDLRDEVIVPTLRRARMISPAAVDLLLVTAAHESNLGYYLRQRGGGHAVGIYQIEPSTAIDLANRYLRRRVDIGDRIEAATQFLTSVDIDWGNVREQDIAEKLTGDLFFATAFARLRYWMVPDPLPSPEYSDPRRGIPKMGYLRALAEYHKEHFNTMLGKANPDRTVADFQRFVLPGLEG